MVVVGLVVETAFVIVGVVFFLFVVSEGIVLIDVANGIDETLSLVLVVVVIEAVDAVVFMVVVTGVAIVDVLIAVVLIFNNFFIVSVVVDVVDVVGDEQGLCPETASSLAAVLPTSVAFKLHFLVLLL